MKVALIVAIDSDRGIGKNNDLMWDLPRDMQFFKETTSKQIVVMGRKNYESIPERFRPLPNRENVVLTRNPEYEAAGCLIFHSLKTCLGHYQEEKDRKVFIIGGGEIYKQALESNIVDEMYITHVNASFDADTFFPAFDLREWKVETVLSQTTDEKHNVSFISLKYSKQEVTQ